MTFLKLFPVAVAFSLAVLSNQANACTCSSSSGGLCDYYDSAAAVVRARVLSRTDGADLNDEATYAVNTTTLYKQEPDVEYTQEITFITAGNSAACGVQLDIGEEYILALGRLPEDLLNPDRSGQFTVGLCNLVQFWSAAGEDELVGCGADACSGNCDELQECLKYESQGNWYCSDICTKTACPWRTCETVKRSWCRDTGFPGCPEKRSCI